MGLINCTTIGFEGNSEKYESLIRKRYPSGKILGVVVCNRCNSKHVWHTDGIRSRERMPNIDYCRKCQQQLVKGNSTEEYFLTLMD